MGKYTEKQLAKLIKEAVSSSNGEVAKLNFLQKLTQDLEVFKHMIPKIFRDDFAAQGTQDSIDHIRKIISKEIDKIVGAGQAERFKQDYKDNKEDSEFPR